MPSAVQCQQKEKCQLHGSKLGGSAQGSTASPHWHETWGSPWPNKKHVLKEVIVLGEEIAHYLPMGAQGQGEKRPHACQILLFVMM